MTIELNREAIAQVTALPAVTEAAEAGSALISLWPLTEAMQMDNDAKYAENLQVRVTRAFARVLTGEDVTVPDAEFVYEGADEIPRPPTEHRRYAAGRQRCLRHDGRLLRIRRCTADL